MKRSIDVVTEASLSSDGEANKKIKLWCPMDYLVQDTLELILSKLDPKNQRHARLVCMKWFNTINLSVFNIGSLHRDELPSVVSVLSRYTKPISISFKNLGRINPDTISHLAKLTNLIELSGNIQQREDFLSALIDLRSLTTDQVSTDVFAMLRKLTKLSCKELTGVLTTPVTQLIELRIKESSDLKVSVNLFPNLKRLTADFGGDCFLTGLESLILGDEYTCDGFPITLTQLKVFRSKNPVDHLTRLTRLKHLDLNSTRINISPFPLLEKWHAIEVRSDDIDFWEQVSSHSHLTSLFIELEDLPSNEAILSLTNLRALKIIPPRLGEIQFDMSAFSSLSRLTRLEILAAEGYTTSGVNNCTSLIALTNLRKLSIDLRVTESFANAMTNLTSLRLWMGFIGNKQKHCFTQLTNLAELNLEWSERPTEVIDGLDELTFLTKLTVETINDDEWQRITKLTNLQSYAESNYIGHNKDRYTDLRVMQHLTFLHVGVSTCSVMDHLTVLTHLQSINGHGFSGVPTDICAKLPFCKEKVWPNKYSIHMIENRTVGFVTPDSKK